MTRSFLLFAALAAVAACGSNKPPANSEPRPNLDDPKPAEPAPAKPVAAATCDDLPAAVDRVIESQMAGVPPDQLERARAAVEASLPKIKAAMQDSCTTDKWSAEATACLTKAHETKDWDACTPSLTAAQQQSLQTRLSSAMQPPLPPPESYDLAPDVGIKECDAYLKSIVTAVKCEKLDEPARDAARSAAAEQKKAWKDMPKKTAKEKKAVATSCTEAMKTLTDAATGAGCPL
jgi:hypothetical protein